MSVSFESAEGLRGGFFLLKGDCTRTRLWHSPGLWSALVCALVLAVVGYRCLVDPRMHEGLDEDENMTLLYYTWMGTDGEGFPRPVDLAHPPKPTARGLGIGLFCSLGRWPEPNNHILNSLLANFTLALPGDKLVNLRLPALVGAAVFAAALAGLLIGQLGWRWAGPLAVLLAFGCPYVQVYSQQSRGYTWMLALQVLLLVGLCRLGRRPRSARWGVFCAGLAVLSFMNIVNMSVDWLLPVYLTFLAFPRLLLAEGAGADDRRALRRNLLLQMIAIAAVGVVFLMDRLPFVISSMRQYGESWSGWGELAGRWMEILRYLFPNAAWMALFFCGLAGAVLAWRQRRARPILAACLASVVVSFLHFLGTGRFPYLRGCGFLLPLVLVGAAGLAEQILTLPVLRRRGPRNNGITKATKNTRGLRGLCDSRLPACGAWAGVMVLGVLCVSSWAVPRPSTQEHDRAARLFEDARAPEGASVVQIAGLHLPAQPPRWSTWSEARIDQFPPPLYLGVVQLASRSGQAGRGTPTFFANGEPGKGVTDLPPWDALAWPTLALDKTCQDYRLALLAGKLTPCPPEGLGRGEHGVFFWYVDAESVAISPDKLHDLLARHHLRYHVVKRRLYVKMLVFKRVWLVILYSSSPQEFQQVNAAFGEGRQQFGSNLWAFLPAPRAPLREASEGDRPRPKPTAASTPNQD